MESIKMLKSKKFLGKRRSKYAEEQNSDSSPLYLLGRLPGERE